MKYKESAGTRKALSIFNHLAWLTANPILRRKGMLGHSMTIGIRWSAHASWCGFEELRQFNGDMHTPEHIFFANEALKEIAVKF